MKRNRWVLNVSCLCAAALLGWYFRGVYDSSVKSDRRAQAQATQDPRATAGSTVRPVPASGSGGAVIRDTSQPATPWSPVVIPPGAQPVDAEIDPATGVVRLTRSEQGAAQPPPVQMKPADMPQDEIEVDPVTGAIRRVSPPAGTQQSPTPPAVKTQDARRGDNSPTAKKLAK